jgi:hypothetical protein
MTALNPEVVPSAGRPVEVDDAVTETLDLRARFREAQAQLAVAQADLEAAEAADVEAAAKAIRAGESPPAASASIRKCRDKLATAQRHASVLDLAVQTAQADLDRVTRASSTAWLDALDEAKQAAVERGLRAIAELEAACAEANAAASAASWVRGGIAGQFAPTVVGSLAAFAAPTSARASANGQAFDATQITTWARELLVPPPQRGFGRITVDASDAA